MKAMNIDHLTLEELEIISPKIFSDLAYISKHQNLSYTKILNLVNQTLDTFNGRACIITTKSSIMLKDFMKHIVNSGVCPTQKYVVDWQHSEGQDHDNT